MALFIFEKHTHSTSKVERIHNWGTRDQEPSLCWSKSKHVPSSRYARQPPLSSFMPSAHPQGSSQLQGPHTDPFDLHSYPVISSRACSYQEAFSLAHTARMCEDAKAHSKLLLQLPFSQCLRCFFDNWSCSCYWKMYMVYYTANIFSNNPYY